VLAARKDIGDASIGTMVGMRDLFALLYPLVGAGLVAATAVLLLSPLLFWSRAAGASTLRRTVGAVVAYVAIAATLGGYAYAVVPAQYTRDLRWNWPPTSNSLGEIHGVYLERLRNPEAISSENAPGIRASIERERAEFAWRWLILSGAGATVPAAGWSMGQVLRASRRAA
jgi:hypothetical protein